MPQQCHCPVPHAPCPCHTHSLPVSRPQGSGPAQLVRYARRWPVPSAQSLDGIEWLLFRNINRISNRFFSQAPFWPGFLENTPKTWMRKRVRLHDYDYDSWKLQFDYLVRPFRFFFLAWKHLIAYCEMWEFINFHEVGEGKSGERKLNAIWICSLSKFNRKRFP